jgi:hypothetical protein
MSRNALFAAVAAAILAPLAADAGYVGDCSVTIETTPNRMVKATGSIAAARRSPDSVTTIGCYIGAVSSQIVGFCSAQTVNGTMTYCTTSDPKFLSVIASIGPESQIQFSGPLGGGLCNSVWVGNFSSCPASN